MSSLKKELEDWFLDNNGVYYQRQISMIFEEKYTHSKVRDGLNPLQEEKEWLNKDKETWGKRARPIHFYYTDKAESILGKKARLKKLLEQLNGGQKGHDVGRRARNVVERTLLRLNFDFIAEDAQKYKRNEWDKDKRDLDLIMGYGDTKIGIEVKNKNKPPQKRDIEKKIEIAEYLGLKPVYVARYFPERRKRQLREAGGYPIELEKHYISPYFSNLEKILESTQGFSPSTSKTLPKNIWQDFLKWVCQQNSLGD